jgi:indoleamine 2,3-dioxygenase
MFPNGVVYEGVSEEPTFFRGESGANDSIIPSADNFLQLTSMMPNNPLTEILRDFRTYRPGNHNEWLEWLEKEANGLRVREYCLRDDSSSVLYLALVDQVREFRNRHWSFTKEYIIKYTQHPVATGGSPIVTWLPNQLGVVLSAMTDVGAKLNLSNMGQQDRILATELKKRSETQNRILKREVAELSKRFIGQNI